MNSYSPVVAEALQPSSQAPSGATAAHGRSWRRTLHQYGGALADTINRHPGALLLAFAAVFVAGMAARAWLKPLWFDEILALHVSAQPTVRDIWNALLMGADLHPPVHYLLSHLTYAFTGSGSFGLRFPAIVGFGVMELCLFQFVARRTSPVYGAVAMGIPLSTRAVDYAVEGRPYGVMLGFAALALLAWQSAAEDRPTRTRLLSVCGLALALAAAISTSYHAVLIFAPLAIGEAIRLSIRRRVDWPVLVAIAVGGLPLLFYLPLMAAPLSYLATMPHRAGLEKVLDTYAILLTPATIPAVAAAIALACYPGGSSGRPTASPGFRQHEVAAVIGFTLLPFVSFALAIVRTNTFLWVYVMPTVIGLALLGAMTAYYSMRRSRGKVAILACVLLGWFAIRQPVPVYSALVAPRATPSTTAVLVDPPVNDLPIVIGDPIMFLRLVQEAPAGSPPRFYYLTDLAQAQRFTGQDSGERSLLDLAKVAAVPLRPYQEFTSRYRRFYLHSSGKRWEWVLSKLLEDGARVEVTRQQLDQSLLLVSLPSSDGGDAAIRQRASRPDDRQ